jgi:hypothetical protein
VNLYIGFATGGTHDYFGCVAGRFIGRISPVNRRCGAEHAGTGPRRRRYPTPGAQDGGVGRGHANASIEEALRLSAVRYKAAGYLIGDPVGAGSGLHLERCQAKRSMLTRDAVPLAAPAWKGYPGR